LEKHIIGSSGDIARYLQIKLKDHRHEVFAVLFLNRANKVNHFEIISEGGITGTVADPRIILRKALEEDAVNIILCHNHPSGSLKPSRADEELTKKIKAAALLLDIAVVDHIIVSEDGYYSFADEGIL
jgi:DNA repair protein RadC